jgi:hypothetical protein
MLDVVDRRRGDDLQCDCCDIYGPAPGSLRFASKREKNTQQYMRKSRILVGTGSQNSATSGTRSRSGSVVAYNKAQVRALFVVASVYKRLVVAAPNKQVNHVNAYRGIIFRIGTLHADELELILTRYSRLLDRFCIVQPHQCYLRHSRYTE